MLVLDNGDKIQGDASAATVVDFTIHGMSGTTLSQLADGQLADSIGDIYTAGDIVVVKAITLVNTDSSARTINLYLLPSGGTARRILPKDLTLGVGHAVTTDGVKVVVLNPAGSIIYSYADHATAHEDGGGDEIGVGGLSGELADNQPPKNHASKHTDGSDDVRDATNALKGLATAAQITALEANTAASHSNAPDHTQGTDVALGGVSAKDPPIDADKALYRDSTDTDALVTSTWTQIKAFLKTYFDGVYQAVNTAILKTAFNAKGDILSASGDDTPLILTVSDNDKVLVADSNEATGLKWATAGIGDVSAGANLTDNALVRGDGGLKGVQTSPIIVSDDGEMTNPSQPAVNAQVNTEQANVTGDDTQYSITGDFWDIYVDQNNDFSQGLFTAPVAGMYQFSCIIGIDDLVANHVRGTFIVSTSNRNYLISLSPYACAYVGGTRSLRIPVLCVADMDANDTAELILIVYLGDKYIDVMTSTHFTCALLS